MRRGVTYVRYFPNRGKGGWVDFQGTDLTELDEHQHRGPEVTLQQHLRESVKWSELKSHGEYAPQTWYI